MSTFTVETEGGTAFVTETYGLAGQVQYAVTFQDGGSATLVGSTYGTPGPVTLLLDGWVPQFPITKAERFGDQFNDEWVTRFLTNEEVS